MDSLAVIGFCVGVAMMLLSTDPERRYGGLIVAAISVFLIIAF